MTNTDMKPFLVALLQTAEVLNTALSPQKQAGYWLVLQDLSLEAWQAACVEVMKREAFFPAPVIFREYARGWLLQQRLGAGVPAHATQWLALREALVPPEEIKALMAEVWKQWPA